MQFSSNNLETRLLESAAGQAVYDSLVQANVHPRSVSVEMVKQMLVAEYRYRKTISTLEAPSTLAVC
ncbi:MAG: hypothetical protein GY826_20095 [Fuerstiella sp.]|nr:hypothetical protein [Fuerstiella sp.]